MRERETTARATERENKNRDGHRSARAPPPGTLLNDTVIGYSILISYIDTYPLCDNKPCPVILHVVSSTLPFFLPVMPRSGLIQDEPGETEDTMDFFLKGADIVHINLKPPVTLIRPSIGPQ